MCDCGAEVEPQAVFCCRCGRRFPAPSQPVVPATPPVDAPDEPTLEAPQAPAAAASPPALPAQFFAAEKSCDACGKCWGEQFKFCPECGQELSEAAGLGMRLLVNTPDGDQHEIALDGSPVVLGTGEGVSLQLKDPYASKRHCRFEPTPDGQYQVEDLGSSNGTFVKLTGPAPVTPGSRFLVGTSLICVDGAAGGPE